MSRWSRIRSVHGIAALLMLLGVVLSACGDADEGAISRGMTGDSSATGSDVTSPLPDASPVNTTESVSVTEPPTEGVGSPVADASPDYQATESFLAIPTPDLAACGQATIADPIDYPTGADDVILRITNHFQGPPMPDDAIVPDVSLYGDGRLVVEGLDRERGVDYQVATLTPEGIQLLLSDVAVAEIMVGDAEYAWAMSFRAPVTIFVVNANGRQTTVSVPDLGQMDVPEDVDATEREARERLRPFLTCALNVFEWLPANVIVSGPTPMPIERLEVLVHRAGPPNPVVTPNAQGQIVEPPVREWPFPEPPGSTGEPYDSGYVNVDPRCVILSEETLAAFLPLMDEQLRETRWLHEGEYYWLYPRPLLPDEVGCTDLR